MLKIKIGMYVFCTAVLARLRGARWHGGTAATMGEPLALNFASTSSPRYLDLEHVCEFSCDTGE